MGPITRNKIFLQSYSKEGPELNNLKQFDEYYEDKKNIESETYFYHKPRINKELYQVNFDFESNETQGPLRKKFNLDKMNKEDLNYFFKFIGYYKQQFEENIFFKGASNFEEKALELLEKSNYDIQAALKKYSVSNN